MKSYLNQTGLPRGLRNNNPGNLILTTIAWQGKIPNAQNTDKKFEQFKNLAYGTRAMLIDLIGDIEKKKLNTVSKLIHEYAPAFENNTAAYINTVAKAAGLTATQTFAPTKEILKKLVTAMVQVENGAAFKSYFSEADFEAGYALLPLASKKKIL